jgi:MFS family permease
MSHPPDLGASSPRPGTPAPGGPTPVISAEPIRVIAWRNAVFVIFTLSGLALATWVARLPAVRDQLHLDTAMVGLLILGLSVGAVIGLVVAPHLLALLGPRGSILFCLFLVAAGLTGVGLVSAFVPVLALAMLCLAVFGFGNGMLDVLMNVEGAAAERANGRTLMPLMHAFFSFGTVIGAGLGALASLLNVPVSWNLGIIAVLIVVVGASIVRYLPKVVDVEDETTSAKTPIKQRIKDSLAVWADMRLLLIGLVLLGMAFAEGSANDWLALATVDGHHQDNTTGAIVFGVFVVAMTVGRIAGGPILDRFGRVPVIRWSALLGAIGLLMFILLPVLWVAILGTVLWGLGSSLGFPVGISAAADDPQKAAARVSAVAIIGYCAFLAGPPLLGFLGQHFGILNALFVVLILLILAALAAPAARERTGPFAR